MSALFESTGAFSGDALLLHAAAATAHISMGNEHRYEML
jgi:hypothetical protein